MPRSGCSALHGVNPNKKKTEKVLSINLSGLEDIVESQLEEEQVKGERKVEFCVSQKEKQNFCQLKLTEKAKGCLVFLSMTL